MTNRQFILNSALTLSALALAACGRSPGDRALSGGLIGAGTGAAIGGIVGGGSGAATGALIGGGVGAVGGAATSPRDVDFGRPAWR